MRQDHSLVMGSTDRQLLLGEGYRLKKRRAAEALVDAMATADIDLRAVDVAIDEDGAAAVEFSQGHGRRAFSPDGRTSAAAVLWCLLARHWSVAWRGGPLRRRECCLFFLPAIERQPSVGAL